MDPKNYLTIIIPFLNEGVEVENTVKSILEFSNKNVEILLINDASNDNFDYRELASKYDVTYIENKSRLGVAASRDIGVELCKTDYFLLLDAHMRFYNSNWIDRVLNELQKDPKVLICCQTKSLKLINGEIVEDKDQIIVSGAYINYYDLNKFLEPEWIYSAGKKLSDTQFIPCVLGAGYACSKLYWKSLNGLNGLLIYGSDEPFISLKVWLNHGSCKLLNDVVIGHVYRENSPYNHDSFSRICNRLLFASFLLPYSLRKKAFSVEKFKDLKTYNECVLYLYKNHRSNADHKDELNKKIVRDFSVHERYNRMKVPNGKVLSFDRKMRILKKQFFHLMINWSDLKGNGLFEGKSGAIIFLYHFASFSKNDIILALADYLLDDFLSSISNDIPVNIYSGLAGIGWMIEYLHQNKFIKCDINDILSDIDHCIMGICPSRMHDKNFKYGLGGIVRYMLSRLFTINNYKLNNPFNNFFLDELYNEVKRIIDAELNSDCIDTYIEYILYIESGITLDPSSIYDITILPGLNKFSKKSKKNSLNGMLGLGLELILNFTKY